MKFLSSVALMSCFAIGSNAIAADPAPKTGFNLTTKDLDARWQEIRQAAGTVSVPTVKPMTTRDLDAKWKAMQEGVASLDTATGDADPTNSRCLFGRKGSDQSCDSVGQAKPENDVRGRALRMMEKLGLPGR